MSNPNRVLIIDDEPRVREFFCDAAEEAGFDAYQAGNKSEFAAIYDRAEPTAILLDLTMPDTDGIEFLKELSERKCTAPIILASGKDERVLATAERLGRMFGLNMRGVLQKPVTVPALEAALEPLKEDSVAEPWSPSPGALNDAVEANQITAFFQPKVDLQKQGFPIVGSEALIRWRHPAHGLIAPDEFLPMAEEEGLINLLTDVVLKHVVAQLQRWRDMGVALPVSVNLSPRQLTDLTLPDRIADLLADAGLDSSLLIVEVTENAAMADIKAATEILTRLRLKDIAVSLDDFGAGYSSLVEIYRLPLSELKIDRSLVVDLADDEGARVVLKAIAALARELGLSVCVEGVETASCAEFLQSIGCDKGQGFHFAKPLPAEDYSALLMGDRKKNSDAPQEMDDAERKSFQRKYLEKRKFSGA